MLIVIENLFTPDEVAEMREALLSAAWEDGARTAGSRSIAVKQNLQMPEDAPIAIDLGNRILRRIGGHPQFISAALAEKIYPPKFNLYQDGGHYGVHVDAAVMRVPGADVTLRTDLSATLFLNDPDDYDGGELTIEGPFGAQAVKLPAGDMVLYPSTSLHQVTPVTRGRRIASFFWLQSLVPDEGQRSILYDLDQSIQALSVGRARDDADIDRLTFVYHNLLRRWAQV
ncbi:Fe2+-dependent dioxygenase [Novosphingobium sp. FSY-8]|uniref:Fe2+-dependent dioxygenase n=1 Tax=Novosphingobium ovatum TaxID=1908523 RepID=A0ABW9XEQ8_9SPHN|nr:Fe2+-dependent dioxygenase [Novosphingobium ovatum]NBC37020.1 Fe2+-dependent dioxygenase [Novosphingobium ovatum]